MAMPFSPVQRSVDGSMGGGSLVSLDGNHSEAANPECTGKLY